MKTINATLLGRYTSAAETGAAWLDENHPGWLDKVHDPEAIDLESTHHCIAGMVFGGFTEALDSGVFTGDEVERFGFDIDVVAEGSYHTHFSILTQAWRVLVRDRIDNEQGANA